jgi:hypothetical protein
MKKVLVGIVPIWRKFSDSVTCACKNIISCTNVHYYFKDICMSKFKDYKFLRGTSYVSLNLRQWGEMKKICFFLLTICLTVTACQKEQKNKLTNTKWKLAGIVDTQTGVLTELEPKDCDRCYTLDFDNTDTIVRGFTSSNSFGGTYEVDYSTHSFKIVNLARTLVGEQEDGHLYLDILYQIQSFSILNKKKKNELWLYHNDKKNYLLFKRIES